MVFNFNNFYVDVVRGGRPVICGHWLTPEQLVDLNTELTNQVVRELKAGNVKQAEYTAEYQSHLNTRRRERYLAYKVENTDIRDYTKKHFQSKLKGIRAGLLVSSTGMHITQSEYLEIVEAASGHLKKHHPEQYTDYLLCNWKSRVISNEKEL